MIRLAMSSVACTAIIPMQDILGLGGEARMNYPSKTQGNYQWRLLPEQMELDGRLREMTGDSTEILNRVRSRISLMNPPRVFGPTDPRSRFPCVRFIHLKTQGCKPV